MFLVIIYLIINDRPKLCSGILYANAINPLNLIIGENNLNELGGEKLIVLFESGEL